MSAETIKTRKFEKAGFTYIVERVFDSMGDASFLTDENKYDDCSADDKAKYQAQDAERMRRLEAGDWYFVGVTVSIRKQTDSNWADGGLEVGRSSVWGIESDSDDSFFEEVENDLIAEAEEELAQLRKALCA